MERRQTSGKSRKQSISAATNATQGTSEILQKSLDLDSSCMSTCRSSNEGKAHLKRLDQHPTYGETADIRAITETEHLGSSKCITGHFRNLTKRPWSQQQRHQGRDKACKLHASIQAGHKHRSTLTSQKEPNDGSPSHGWRMKEMKTLHEAEEDIAQ